MTRFRRPFLLAAGALLATAPALLADEIYQTDGRVLDDVSISNETIAEVTYKKGKETRTVASDKVLRVVHTKFPRLLGEAETALAENDLLSALDTYDEYSEGQIRNPTAKASEAWAPPYAAWRCVELRMEVANLDGAIEKAAALIQAYPDSRYLPAAFLAKASAELQSGKAPKASATLTEFARLITSQSLSKRWDLECRLAQIQADTKATGEAKREKLGDIIGEASRDYPTVKSRARVVEGETYLDEAEAVRTNEPKASGLRAQAQKIFSEIVANPKADEETLAGAYTGLGDCLFYEGWQKNDAPKLEQALLNYLRVAVNFNGQSKYVPKALFYAMRCFDLLAGTPDEDAKKKYRSRKLEMKRELLSLYPDSRWAKTAERDF